MEEAEELLDIFDADERVIQTVKRGEYYAHPELYPGYLRFAEVFLKNDEGKLWIPMRTARKTIAPNGLDYSCGGHVSSGEDYMVSCLREMEEELNLRLQASDLILLQASRADEPIRLFRHLYLYKSNVTPDYNHEDFQSFEWLTPAELQAKLEAGVPAKSSLLPSIRAIAHLL